jgi:mono/diheme cytochrome c family protein
LSLTASHAVGIVASMAPRAALLLVLLTLAVVAVGCGGGEEVGALPETVEGPVPTDAQPPEEPPEEPGEEPGEEPAEPGEPNPEAGADVFAAGGCGGCHVYEPAGTTGTVGPSLDETETPYDEAVEVITNGRGAMPAFRDRFSEQEIADVSAFISDADPTSR